jgi:hypothetical protein
MDPSDIDLYLEIQKRCRSGWVLAGTALIFLVVIAISGLGLGFGHRWVAFLGGAQVGVLFVISLMVLAARFDWAKGHREALLDIVQRQIDRDEEATQYMAARQNAAATG